MDGKEGNMTDWLGILFGGAGVTVVGLIAAYVAGQIKKEKAKQNRYSKYYGKYQTYHLNTSCNGNIVRSFLSIYQGKTGEPEIYFDCYGNYNYKGTMELIGNTIYMNLRGNHPELLRIVCAEPLGDTVEVLPCVYAAVTGKWWPTCGKLLLVKSVGPEISAELEPDKDQIDNRILDFMLCIPKNPCRVRPMNRSILANLHEAIDNYADRSNPPNLESEE